MNRYGKYERLVNQLIFGQCGLGEVHLRATSSCVPARRRPKFFIQRLETIWEEPAASAPRVRSARRHT